jgi:hypothetical protein
VNEVPCLCPGFVDRQRFAIEHTVHKEIDHSWFAHDSITDNVVAVEVGFQKEVCRERIVGKHFDRALTE